MTAVAAEPQFLIAGASKAGTTWLRICLSEHPDVFIPAGPTPNFFSDHWEKGIDWYRSLFKDWRGQKAIGEKSTAYIIADDVPRRIASWNPRVQLIFVLREPLERAYSHYCMHYRGGRVSADVDAELSPESKLIREGFYYSHMKRFLEYFPREQMHILLHDDMEADRAAFFRGVCRIIGVSESIEPPSLKGRAHVRKGQPRFPALFRLRVATTRFLTRRSALADRVVGRMRASRMLNNSRLLTSDVPLPTWSAESRRRIAQGYVSDVEQLSKLVGRDLSHWLRPYLQDGTSMKSEPVQKESR
jgi:hypothetical protein